MAYSDKQYDEEIPFLARSDTKDNPFAINEELRNLQMPDHRKAVNPLAANNDVRPESKKGHDLVALEHHNGESNGYRRENLNRTNYTANNEEMGQIDEIEEPIPFDHEPYFGQGKCFSIHTITNYSIQAKQNQFQLQNTIKRKK